MKQLNKIISIGSICIASMLVTSSAYGQETVFVNTDCENTGSISQKNRCYEPLNKQFFMSHIAPFYAGAPDLYWDRPKDVKIWSMAVSKNPYKLFEMHCRGDQACMYDLIVREADAIEEKMRRYKYKEINYREEVINNFSRKLNIAVHSDSEFMAQKFGFSNIQNPPEWSRMR